MANVEGDGPEDALLVDAIGDRVRHAREAKGLSEAALAAMVGLGEAAIKKLEAGGSKAPSFPNGLLISAALEVPAWTLAFGKPPPASKPQGLGVQVRDDSYRFEISIEPGYFLVSEDQLKRAIESVLPGEVRRAVESGGYAVVRPPAAGAAGTESPGPSAAPSEDRLAKLETDAEATAAAIREIRRSLGLRPGSRKKVPPSA